MGGGDDVPAAPDYTDLFKAAKEASDYSYGKSKEQFDFFKTIYNKNSKYADIVTDKAFGEMDKLIADSDRARARYQNIYEPLEEQYAQQAQDYSSPARMEEEAGAREADVALQFEAARQTAQDRLEAYGVDPSQTRSGAMDLASRVNEASAQAAQGNAGRKEVEEIGRRMTENAINTGRGVAASIPGSSQAGGQAANQGINTQLATTASGAQTTGTSPQWAQIGNQSLGTWGNLKDQSFGNQMAQYDAEQKSSSGWGSVVGTALGAATMFLAEGGAIPDEQDSIGAIPPEASPSGGAITDDVDAQIASDDGSTQNAKLNAGEFVLPKRTVQWYGEKGIQQFIAKGDKEMGIPEQPDAAPSTMPPPGSQPSYDGAGIPA